LDNSRKVNWMLSVLMGLEDRIYRYITLNSYFCFSDNLKSRWLIAKSTHKRSKCVIQYRVHSWYLNWWHPLYMYDLTYSEEVKNTITMWHIQMVEPKVAKLYKEVRKIVSVPLCCTLFHNIYYLLNAPQQLYAVFSISSSMMLITLGVVKGVCSSNSSTSTIDSVLTLWSDAGRAFAAASLNALLIGIAVIGLCSIISADRQQL